jgi:hypothetical protein
MGKECDLVIDSTRTWMSVAENYGRIGGSISWGVKDAPVLVEYLTGWPVVTLRLVNVLRRARVQTAMQIRKSSWHAHLPRERLGIPTRFVIGAAASRSCLRREGDFYVFDFTGMSPLRQDDTLERRAVVLLEEMENFRRHHLEVLDQLGVEVIIRFRDDTQ